MPCGQYLRCLECKRAALVGKIALTAFHGGLWLVRTNEETIMNSERCGEAMSDEDIKVKGGLASQWYLL